MKITISLLFSFMVFSTSAQNNPYAPPPPPPPPPSSEINAPDVWGARYFHFGLNFTPGIYWVSPNSSNDKANGTSFGFNYGANLEFYFSRNYAFLTGFEIANISANYINNNPNPTPSTLDSTIAHDESLQYLQIPLELKLKTVPFRHMRYYGVVGLDLGFLLKATDDCHTLVSLGGPPGYPAQDYSGNGIDIYRQTDFFRASLVIGLGAEYQLIGSTALQASLTYNNCFTNLNSTSSNAVNIKGVELMLGVLF